MAECFSAISFVCKNKGDGDVSQNNISGIYKIENLVNGKIYVGQSVNIKKRWKDHKYYLRHNLHQNRYIQRAWNKQGEENYSFSIIEECDKELLGEKESYYINLFKSNNFKFGYNCTSGGENYTLTEGTRKIRVLANHNNKPILQIDLNGNIINEWRGTSDIHRNLLYNTRNIRACCNNVYGRKTALGFIWIYKHNYNAELFNLKDYTVKNKNSKQVNQYDLEDNFIISFESAREAERVTGIGYKMISRCCNGGRPYTHGFIWKFAS